MKRTICFDLTSAIEEIAYPHERIKSRKDLVKLCLKACRELTYLEPKIEEGAQINQVVLKCQEMRRLFFFKEKKFVSISLPVNFTINDQNRLEFYYGNVAIESEMWSKMIQRANYYNYEWMDEDWFLELNTSSDPKVADFENTFNLFNDAEYGYIRYDHDIVGYNEAKKQNKPHKHPLHHADIHLSNESTFKVGFSGKVTPQQFIDILDNEQLRYYFIDHSRVKTRH